MTQACNTAGKPVVLIVDDAPEYLTMLGGMLEGTYTVRVASSGRRALQLAAQEPTPDLVLLDVLMPDMDGYAVLAALRKDTRTSETPVIFLSSLQAASDELVGLALGAADYIVKPALPQVVQARVRTQIELKRMRDSLRERNKALQDAMADLEAFSYTVSHDLRAPLSAISTFAGALRHSEASLLTDHGRHRLDRILAGSARMNTMIDEILACSRADRGDMHCQLLDLDALAADVIAQFQPCWPAASIKVSPLPKCRGDAVMLRQVFANLVGNALKFSAGRSDAVVEVFARVAGEATEIVVRDNGAGFDAAHAHKLFGLFQRLHSEAEFPGTGVGLAIVKRIVARHGGQVRAESVPGERTTFAFTLGGGSVPAWPGDRVAAQTRIAAPA